MKLYDALAYDASRMLTLRYSSSFGSSSKLFAARIRPHIYAVYGLVRIADEIVDDPSVQDAALLLDELERQTYHALAIGYSSNPIVHAFALTARQYAIDRSLVAPFFDSMRMDLEQRDYTEETYKTYIYGSAEVVGLMCLRVFCEGDSGAYGQLQAGAQALGAAYQKVNFLRDMAADYRELGRWYVPGCRYETFDDHAKQAMVADIRHGLLAAQESLRRLPPAARRAVAVSVAYYTALLDRLAVAPVAVIKQRRLRIGAARKLWLLCKTLAKELRT